MTVKRIYVFDEANLQAIIDLEGEEPRVFLDWSTEVTKLAMLVAAAKLKISEATDKPVFKFTDELGMIIGEYVVVAFVEGEEKENVRRLLSKIYIDLVKEKPISSDEVGETVLRVLQRNN